SFQPVLCERGLDSRDEIAAVRFVVSMLELTATAFREMAAQRKLVMRSKCQCAIIEHRVAWNSERHVPPAWRDAVAARGNPDDRLVHSRQSSAWEIAAKRSSAIMWDLAIFAARPCSQTPAHAASNAGMPRARKAAIIPERTSPVPALASHPGAGGRNPRRPSGDATSVSAPL